LSYKHIIIVARTFMVNRKHIPVHDVYSENSLTAAHVHKK